MAGWEVIAATGGRLLDLGPYVPSVAAHSRVAFTAALRDGGDAVLVGDAGRVDEVVGPAAVVAVTSHPDVDLAGRTSVYAEVEAGVSAVVLVEPDGRIAVLASTGERFAAIGPAGPTMNDHGAVGFRATEADGRAGIYVADAAGVSSVAVEGERWAGFHGLPVVLADGTVVFRADAAAGVAGIYAWRDGALATVAETGDELTALGRFPCASDDGAVACAATFPDGREAVVRWQADGGSAVLLDTADGRFASCRGGLVDGRGRVVGLATPAGGGLGLFAGPDPVGDRLLAIGDPLAGSIVADLAANPVSIDAGGGLVARVALADGRQLVVRRRLP